MLSKLSFVQDGRWTLENTAQLILLLLEQLQAQRRQRPLARAPPSRNNVHMVRRTFTQTFHQVNWSV